MARKQARPQPLQHVTLAPLQTICQACGSHMRMGHHSHRTVTTLQGMTRLTRHAYIAAATRSVRAFINQCDRKRKVDGPCPTENLVSM